MSGFCKECGEPLDPKGRCPDEACLGHRAEPIERQLSRSGSGGSLQKIGPLPKPSTARRFLGSGIEYVAYAFGCWVITGLDLVSGGLLGFLSLCLVALIVLRDFNAGAFSIAKRVSQMRVVNVRTGWAPSNTQALVRNSYYLGLLLLATLLPWISVLFSSLFLMFILLDVMMIVANPRGRRLGDFLAGTQVVEARS